MSEVPVELKFLSSHEWVLVEDNVATIGVSDHAQELLGDLVLSLIHISEPTRLQ